MQPSLDPKGRDQANPARSPTAEERVDQWGRPYLAEPERIGSWDVDTDAALRSDSPVLGSSADTAAPLPLGTPSGAQRDQAGAQGKAAAIATRKSLAQRRRLKLTQKALALRVAGYTVTQIAAEFGVASATVTAWFSTHRRAVERDELERQLDEIAAPLAIENLHHGLIAGDKDYTLETLKGRGFFRKHSEGEGRAPDVLPVLAISFSMPTPDQMQGREDVPMGLVVGAPQQPKAIGSGSTVDTSTPPVLSSPADPSDAAAPAPAADAALAIGRPLGQS